MRVNEALAKALRANGVEVMFGVMGDANMYIVDQFVAAGGRFIATANEGGAVLMAAGFAAVSGKVGVATITHGAITNCVSALFDATRGRYPVLLIAGDTARADGFNLQNVPQQEVVLPTGAGYRQVRSIGTAVDDLAAALRTAAAERRPVVLELPADFQQAECSPARAGVAPVVKGAVAPSREALEDAASIIIGSTRPVVIGGRGAAAPAARSALLVLAERIGAPLATTLRGKGLFAGDPFNLGICGTLAHPVATDTIVKSDCLVAFGASLSALTTMKGEFLAGKRVIQFDVDEASLGRFYPVDLGVVGDAELSAAGLVEVMDEAEAPPSRFRSQDLAESIAKWTEQDRLERPHDAPLDITGVLHRINRIVPRERTLTIDGGRFSHEALRIVDVSHPTHYAHCLNIGHIGMSVGYGIGAAIAKPDAPGLVVAGDGGFMLGGLAEFNTAVRHNVNIVVFILNDGAYGAEYYRFIGQSLDPTLTTFDWPDLADLATAHGGVGVAVREWADFDRAEAEIRRGSGPVLVNVLLDPACIPDPGVH